MASPRTKFDFLHGIRGLAALYVVAFHLYINAPPPSYLPAPVLTFFHLLNHGYVAVAVFIVLSGFCLTLPVARTSGLILSGGIGGFLKRRAWRILPPYWGTLVVFWCFWRGIAAFVNTLTHHVDPGLVKMQHQALRPVVLLTHVLLIHNLFPEYSGAMTGILWTVALEWQIYFVFALVLLAIWRRFGLAPAVGLAFLLGLGPVYLAPGYAYFNPWMLCLFALGMAGAYFAQNPGIAQRIPWPMLSWVFAVGVLIHTIARPNYYDPAATLVDKSTIDLLIGLTTVCALVHAVLRTTAAPDAPPRSVRLLQKRPVMRIADFSYSLYLTHGAIVMFMAQLTAIEITSAGWRFFIMEAVGLPFALAFAYVFYIVLERPTVSSRDGFRLGFPGMRRGTATAPVGAITPRVD